MNKLLVVTTFFSLSFLSLSLLWALMQKPVLTKKPSSNLKKGDDFNSRVVNLSSETAQAFLHTIKSAMIVYFYADWFAPCLNLKFILEDVAYELKDSCMVAKINIDTCQALVRQYHIKSLPTILILNNGKLLDSITDLQDKDRLIQSIKSTLKNSAQIDYYDQAFLNEKLIQSLQNYSSLDEIRSLLELGADVNYQGSEGLTPLMAAITNPGPYENNLEIIQLLLDYGASPELTAQVGGKKITMVEYLMNAIETWDQKMIYYQDLTRLLEHRIQKKPIYYT